MFTKEVLVPSRCWSTLDTEPELLIGKETSFSLLYSLFFKNKTPAPSCSVFIRVAATLGIITKTQNTFCDRSTALWRFTLAGSHNISMGWVGDDVWSRIPLQGRHREKLDGEGPAFPGADGQPGGCATLTREKKTNTTISVCNQFLFFLYLRWCPNKTELSFFKHTVLNIYPECFPFWKIQFLFISYLGLHVKEKQYCNQLCNSKWKG